MSSRGTRMRMGGHNSRTVLASVIAGIFASTTVGVWYDPSDFSSMYQDSVGSAPVTSVEQPVGLMLDKSKGATRSAELLGNGNFEDGTTGWNPGTGWSVTGGRAEVNNAGAASHITSTTATGSVITVGKFYEITYDVQVTAGAIQMDCGGGTAPAANSPIGPVTRRAIVRATAGFGFRVYGNATAVGWVDNISVKEIPGNHILMATTTARPVLSARVNLLTQTEAITNAAWLKAQVGIASAPVVTDNYGVAPDGTTTATRVQMALNGSTSTSDYSMLSQVQPVLNGAVYSSGVWLKTTDGSTKTMIMRDDFGTPAIAPVITITGQWQFFSQMNRQMTNSSSATVKLWLRGSLGTSDSVDILFWHPQFEAGPTLGRYQRVGVATDYNAVGFPLYLRFDGVDDYMSTPTVVPLSTTSNFELCLGLAREQSANIAVVTELGPTSNAVNSFGVFAPLTAGSESYCFRIYGTVQVQNSVNYPLGIPLAFTGRAYINGGTVMRYNAGTVATNGTSQAGPLADAQLFLGARTGASLPFKGRIYGYMVFSRRLSATELFLAEKYLGQKSGVFV